MRTHVDNAAAVRIVGTNLFARLELFGSDMIVYWEPMWPRTTFLAEDDEVLLIELCRLAAPRKGEVVHVSRVIDEVEHIRRPALVA